MNFRSFLSSGRFTLPGIQCMLYKSREEEKRGKERKTKNKHVKRKIERERAREQESVRCHSYSLLSSSSHATNSPFSRGPVVFSLLHCLFSPALCETINNYYFLSFISLCQFHFSLFSFLSGCPPIGPFLAFPFVNNTSWVLQLGVHPYSFN